MATQKQLQESAIRKIHKVLNEQDVPTYKGKTADDIKQHANGFVGGNEFTDKASDEDIVEMARLKDEYGIARNRYIIPITNQINAIRKKYKLSPDPHSK